MLPDEYRLIDNLHSSPISRVLLVENPAGEQIVAKLPPLGSATALKRFEREVEAQKRAAGRHTMPILEHADDYSWYLMPRALKVLSSELCPRPLEEALAVLEAIAQALEPIHRTGEVHRDLKPDNILWLDDENGARWVVSDFGIVRNEAGKTTSPLTAIGGLLGTPDWAAPEQYRDAHSVTPATDVYSAGAIVAWLLTGRPPHALDVPLPAGSPVAGSLARALARNSRHRFQSLSEFLDECKHQASNVLPAIDQIISSQAYGDLHSYVLQRPSEMEAVLNAIGDMNQSQVHAWYATDAPGLIEATIRLCDGMAADHRDLSFSSTIDPFLIWSIQVLRELVRSDLSEAQRVATSLFGAIADIHQFAPAAAALDWLDTLPSEQQEAMRTAIHASGSWDFFRKQAGDRFPSKRRSKLVQDLSLGFR